MHREFLEDLFADAFGRECMDYAAQTPPPARGVRPAPDTKARRILDASGDRRLDALDDEHLDDVADLEVVVALEGQAALEAGLDLRRRRP